MSENIFTELYNKILGLFGQTSTEKEDSKETAVNRLRLVLMQDRTNLTPEIMHRMRSELIEVLSKYVELDKEALELNFEQEGEQMALMLSIPVIRAKDEEEIEKALQQDDNKEQDLEEDLNSDELNDQEFESDNQSEDDVKNDDADERVSEDEKLSSDNDVQDDIETKKIENKNNKE